MTNVTLARDRQLKWLSVDKIVPNERNPRGQQHFREVELADLRRSIEQHGILEPLIVTKYPGRGSQYLLIEGERRFTVAKSLGMKEVPAVVQPKVMEADDQVVLMYNLHENRRGWEMADHLRAIKRLMESRPDVPEEDLAKELGLSLATFRDRLRVLGMGDKVVEDIAKGNLDYTSALRSAQAATAITKKRPELAKDLGGEKKIAEQLIRKAKARGDKGGISHELTAGKQDLTDTEHVPDSVIKQYIKQPESNLRDLRNKKAPQQAARQEVKSLAKSVLKVEEDLKALEGADLTQATNLLALHNALQALITVASAMDNKITDAILARETAPQTESRVQRRRKAGEKPQPDIAEAMQAEQDQKDKEKVEEQVQESLAAAGA